MVRMFKAYGLPVRAPLDVDIEAAIAHMAVDKKNTGGRVKSVFLKEIG